MFDHEKYKASIGTLRTEQDVRRAVVAAGGRCGDAHGKPGEHRWLDVYDENGKRDKAYLGV